MSTIPKGSQPHDGCVRNLPIYSPCFTLEDTSADEGQQIRGSKAMERDAGRMQLPRPMAGWMFPVLLWHPDNQARTVGMLEEDWYHLRTLLVGICQKKGSERWAPEQKSMWSTPTGRRWQPVSAGIPYHEVVMDRHQPSPANGLPAKTPKRQTTQYSHVHLAGGGVA